MAARREQIRMRVLFWYFSMNICGLSSLDFSQHFCERMTHIVFILNNSQPDSSAYTAQLDFAQGLTQRLHSHTYISLLTVEKSLPSGAFLFSISFQNRTAGELKPSMWTRRADAYLEANTAEEFFPVAFRRSQIDVISTVSMVVSLNVPLHWPFYFMGGSYPLSRRDALTDWDIFHKAYQILILPGRARGESDRKFSKRKSRNSVDELKTISFNDVLNFQYNFNMVYNDICRAVRIFPNALYSNEMLGDRSALGCNVTECGIHLEYSIGGVYTVTARFLQYGWKVVIDFSWFFENMKTDSLVSNMQKAKRICSSYGMSLVTVRSQQEARQFGSYLEALRAFIPDPRENLIGDYVRIIIGLSRSKETVGQRFRWGNGRDLTFSTWAEREPRGGNQLGCAVWTVRKTDWEHGSWHSSNCGDKQTGEVILCHHEPLPNRERVVLSSNSAVNVSEHRDKIYVAEMYTADKLEEHYVTSLSLSLSSGFLKNLARMRTKVFIKGLVHERTLAVTHTMENKAFPVGISMTYPCHVADDTVSSKQGVPFSQVCDDKRDCGSGADETFCDEASYRTCSVDEFTCASRQCVSLAARCDLLSDCRDRSDEKDCELECPHKTCTSGRCLPRSWFGDGQVDCPDESDEHANNVTPEKCAFICNRTQCVTRGMLNDTVVDCKGPEGPLDETLGTLLSIDCIQHREHLSFVTGWAPKCILFYDNFGEILGCRDFQHLENCESFVCPVDYVKCPESFCIPLAYVNDGKQDCEDGQDEGIEKPLGDLSKYFRCHPLKNQWVPLSSLCDNRRDCLQGEDELDCGYSCFPGFICLSGSVSAIMYNKTLPAPDLSFINSRTRYLDLSGLNLPDFFSVYPREQLAHLLKLNVSRCQIRDVLRHTDTSDRPVPREKTSACEHKVDTKDFISLQNLDLSHNELRTITECSFISSMLSLRKLDLSHNSKLTYLSETSLKRLKKLMTLDLSFTGVTHFIRKTFISLGDLETLLLKQTRVKSVDFILPRNLQYFNVEQTGIEEVDAIAFSQASSMKVIRSSSSKLCCPVVLGPQLHSRICESSRESISSCTDLVKEAPLRAMLWLVCSATLVGNIITLLYRFTLDRTLLQRSYGVFVTNLGVSDLLMGGYLVMIAVADARFSGEYALHDYTWRHSHGCKAAGSMATLSSITSTVFVSLITVDRFLVVRYPFGEFRFTHKTMAAAVMGTWLFGVAVALLPLLPFAQDWVIYSRSGMCLGLPLKNERLPGWQYSVTLFIGLNFMLFLLIGIGQGAIYRGLKEKGKRTRQTMAANSEFHQRQRLQEFTIAKRLSLVVMSNFLCWFPVITMGLMALAGQPVGEAAYRWSAVMVLPVNSALNPLLYTLPALKTRWEDFTQARKQAKASASRTRQESDLSRPSPGVRSAWRRCIRTLIALKEALVTKHRPGILVISNLEILYERVAGLQETCHPSRSR